jgi:hypothetical protein
MLSHEPVLKAKAATPESHTIAVINSRGCAT